jgi:hypothetical protein
MTTGHERRGDRGPRTRRRSRRAAALVAALALVTTACGDDAEDAPVASEVPSTTAAPEATEAPQPTDPPDTTEAPATTEAPTVTEAPAAGAALRPEVVCRTFGDAPEDVAFAYVNEGPDAVVLDPAATTVVGGDEVDLGFVPVVFAPGRVSPAFWITPTDQELVEGVTWTIVGPDGETREATADLDTPICDEELLAPTTEDPREPQFQFGEPVLAEDGESVTFTSSVVGVPEESVCASGLEPSPVSIVIDNVAQMPSDYVAVEGSTADWSVPLSPPAEDGTRSGFQHVGAIVLDQCGVDGVVQATWPGGSFEDLYGGVRVCLTALDGSVTLTTSEDDPTCTSGLPGTGGGRSRPG